MQLVGLGNTRILADCAQNSLQTLELSVKSLKEGSNCGFYPYWRFFLLLNNSLAHRTLTPILKVGCDSGTFSLHLSNFKRILGSKIGYAHRTHHLVSD